MIYFFNKKAYQYIRKIDKKEREKLDEMDRVFFEQLKVDYINELKDLENEINDLKRQKKEMTKQPKKGNKKQC